MSKLQYKFVELVSEFKHQDVIFEKGNVYKILDFPKGFVSYWFERKGHKVLEDYKGESLKDPRPLTLKKAEKIQADLDKKEKEKKERNEKRFKTKKSEVIKPVVDAAPVVLKTVDMDLETEEKTPIGEYLKTLKK